MTATAYSQADNLVIQDMEGALRYVRGRAEYRGDAGVRLKDGAVGVLWRFVTEDAEGNAVRREEAWITRQGNLPTLPDRHEISKAVRAMDLTITQEIEDTERGALCLRVVRAKGDRS